MNARRTHFVYQAFDEFGLLLYVGMTTQPQIRWLQHREASEWTQFARRFKVRGPIAKGSTARRLEREAIRTGRPFFNVQGRPEPSDEWRSARTTRLAELVHSGTPLDDAVAIVEAEIPCEVGPEAYFAQRRRLAVRSA